MSLSTIFNLRVLKMFINNNQNSLGLLDGVLIQGKYFICNMFSINELQTSAFKYENRNQTLIANYRTSLMCLLDDKQKVVTP